MSGKILCVGALTWDTIFRLEALPERGGKYLPLETVEVAEGMAAAQAASIVRLGGEAALWASVGGDATGARLVQQISEAGVDVSRVRTVPGARSGFSTILMGRTGETIIVPQYDAALREPPDGPPDLDGIAAVMCDVRWPGAAELALKAAAERGIPGILDADVAPREVLQRLAPLASHVVASETAATILYGVSDLVAALGPVGSAFVAITSGAKGCYWSEHGNIRHMPAVEVTAIDTLAAGDVFHAAFAVGLVEGWPTERTIRFASAAAAIKCTRFGGRLGAPTRAEVEAVLG
jgi:sulfofructose kinase